MKLHLIPAVTVASALAATLSAQAPSSTTRDEEFARRQYESGLSFMQNKKYDEGLKDFRAVVTSFPKSQVADDALLQIALYEFDIARDAAAAQAAADKLVRDYPDADSTPMAHVLAGRLGARSRSAADIDGALASFERVSRLFPSAAAVPAAGYYAGDTLRAARRLDEAYERFSRVGMEYPGSVWAARAAIAGASYLVQSDRGARAVEGLQRVREQFPGSPEASLALNANTIIYRLYIRAPAQPAYAFSKFLGSETSKFRDVVGVRVDDSGRILVGHKQGIAIFDATSALTRTVAAAEPSAFFVDERGRVVFARRDVLNAEGGEPTPIAIPPPSPGAKARQVEEIPSAVVRSDGERLIVDRKGKVVIRVSPAGKFNGTFAPVNAERLAINWLDDVAMIDREAKTIVIVDRDGKALAKIPARGTGYEFDNPIDLAFDPLGHLYVLDRGRATIFVFGPKNRLVTAITFPEKETATLQKAEAFSVDAAGRLYVFDDRSQRIQVYQ